MQLYRVNLQGKVVAEAEDKFEGVKYISFEELFKKSDLSKVKKGVYFLSVKGSNIKEVYTILIY